MKTKRVKQKMRKSRKMRKQRGGVEDVLYNVVKGIVHSMDESNLQFRKIKAELSGNEIPAIEWIEIIEELTREGKIINFAKDDDDPDDDDVVTTAVRYFENRDLVLRINAELAQRRLDEAGERDQ
jgi:hypothetical protein